MKEIPLLSLEFGDIKNLLGEMSNDYRIIRHDFGFVRSYRGVADVAKRMLIAGQPYRLMEGRILFIRKGEACINLNLRERHLRAPMIIVFSPGTVGEVKSYSDDVDFAMLAFRNSFMDSYRREPLLQSYNQRRLCLCIPLSEKEAERMESLCNLFWDILHDQPLSQEMVRDMILLVFRQTDIYRRHYTTQEKQAVTRQEDVLNRFIDLVNEHAIRERKVAFYADKLCLTPHYLSAIIRAASHQTIMDWINRAVIQEAKIRLRHNHQTISQTADSLHFPNASFFCKYFRRLTGMSPGEYQKSAG